MPLTRCPELDEENPVSLRGVYTRIAELSAHNFTRQNTRVYHFRCTVHNRRREAAPAVALKTPASFDIANQIPVHRPGLEFQDPRILRGRLHRGRVNVPDSCQ